jgi:hypothetical protein
MRCFLLGSLLLLVVSPIAAQTARTPRKPAERSLRKPLPRAADGRPDLQGIWTNDTYTPLERPKGFEDKAFFAEAEEAVFQKQVHDDILALIGEENQKTSGDGGYAEFGKLLPDRRTSLIIDPANGRIPPLLAQARRRLEDSVQRKADGPEDFDASARCLTWPSPPMLPPPSNTHIQVVQTHEHVAIFTETFGEARVVPLDRRPHFPPALLQWKGDARGRGDTLVVDTTNFRPKGVYHVLDRLKGSDESLHVIERFTLIDADTIMYRFTIDDPTVYEKAWTAELPLVRTAERIFEFACHEGNYSLENSLRGARAEERRKAEGPK